MAYQSQSDAETKVLNALQRKLPTPWEIIPSTKYVTSEDDGPLRQGEFDVLVFHPEKGILLIEVKGGGIHYEGVSRKWYSMDRNEKTHPIKDPFEQAQKAERWLLGKIRDSGIFSDGHCPVPVGHAVFFPDIKWGDEPLPPNAARETVLDSSDLMDLEARADEIISRFRNERHTSLNKGEASHLRQRVLYPTCRVMPTLKSRIESDEIELVSMTDEQARLIDNFEDTKQIAIEGYAGTGKTQMAMEKAKLLYNEGLAVALLCYNRPLAEEMKKALISFSDRIYVNTYHGLCDDMCREAGLSFDVPEKGSPEAHDFWRETVPLLMVEAADKLGKKYDAIIVDEGQDFMSFWWDTLLDILADRDEGYFYIFFDSNQAIYQDEIRLPVKKAHMVLKKNCRNTRSIGELVCKMGGVKMNWPGHSVEGEAPVFTSYTTDDEQLEKIDSLVGDLLGKEDLTPEDIVCLSTHKRKKSCLAGVDKLAGVKLTEEILVPGEKIRFSSLHRFKGLEANVVILCDLVGDSDRIGDEHLYVATSRAKHRLYIFHDENWQY